MIYDLESEKFITTIKGAHAVISDLDEHVFKTSFLQDAKYAIIQVDKAQQKFLYLVHHRPNAFSLAYSLFIKHGKASLENLILLLLMITIS
jgi:hypothetical protein